MELVTNNLTFKPENEFFLNNVSLEFNAGKLYSILGRTLAGKTSLLKTIAGLQPIDSGSITFEGKDFGSIPVWEKNIAMIYQQFINYPHLNVFENIAFPLKQRKMESTDINNEVSVAISKVGLDGFEKRKIQELSGGQQQRVALARSLVKNAKILLLDEPLVNLDYKLRENLRNEFKNIFSSDVSSQSILIYASTDPLEVMQLNGEIIVIDEGKILQSGNAKDQYNSVFKKLLKLPEKTMVYPAHDYNGKKFSTIEDEKNNNPRLQVKSAKEYSELMDSLNLENPEMMDIAVPANIKGFTLDQVN